VGGGVGFGGPKRGRILGLRYGELKMKIKTGY
jgi:hypothetical protein